MSHASQADSLPTELSGKVWRWIKSMIHGNMIWQSAFTPPLPSLDSYFLIFLYFHCLLQTCSKWSTSFWRHEPVNWTTTQSITQRTSPAYYTPRIHRGVTRTLSKEAQNACSVTCQWRQGSYHNWKLLFRVKLCQTFFLTIPVCHLPSMFYSSTIFSRTQRCCSPHSSVWRWLWQSPKHDVMPPPEGKIMA